MDANVERRPENDNVVLSAALLHARRGHEERARSLLAGLITKHDGSATGQRDIATVLAILGDHDAAIAHLEKAFELGLETTAAIEADRDLRGLRTDPRFAGLIGKYR